MTRASSIKLFSNFNPSQTGICSGTDFDKVYSAMQLTEKTLNPMQIHKAFLTFGLIVSVLVTFGQEITKGEDGLYYGENQKPYSGQYREYYQDGKLHSLLNLKNGLIDGNVQIFFTNGQLNEIRAFSNGEKHGLWTIWNEDGQKLSEARYTHGQKDGQWFVWNDAGILLYDMTYSAGRRTGTWKMYNQEGILINQKDY